MSRIRLALFGAIFVTAAGIGFALGQAGQYVIASPTGAELIGVQAFQSNGQPSPVNNYVTENTVRNTTGYQLSSSTSGTITTTVGTDNLLLTGAVGTATVDVPPNPPDGQLFSITNASGTTFSGTITIASTDSSTFEPASPTIVNLAAETGQEWQYTAASTKWYRVR